MRHLTLLAATAILAAGIPASIAQAQTVSGDSLAIGSVHSGQDCPINGQGNTGFSGCYATQTGTTLTPGNDTTASQVVAQIGLNGTTDISTNYPTISGNEFSLTLSGSTLTFSYLMGAGDPALTYLSIKQADGYQLFYDPAGFTSGTNYTFNLATYFPNNIGVSHVTVWDHAGAVPEPATWAMMLLGFGGIGIALRRARRRGKPALMQIA